MFVAWCCHLALVTSGLQLHRDSFLPCRSYGLMARVCYSLLACLFHALHSCMLLLFSPHQHINTEFRQSQHVVQKIDKSSTSHKQRKRSSEQKQWWKQEFEEVYQEIVEFKRRKLADLKAEVYDLEGTLLVDQLAYSLDEESD